MEGLDLNSLVLSENPHIEVKSRLYKVWEFLLNYAALLCLLDCIVLPALIALFGVLDIFNGLNAYKTSFHIIEVVCVVILGTLAIVVNYRKGGKVKFVAIGISGIILVVISHFVASGWIETVLSLTGCGMLLASNQLSRRGHSCHHCHLPVSI
ncbi:MerC mercury resistance family protein [Babesia bovis T2Bo]|uniref:MerC domain-containing protein n=1 Tax=Babesia bovis TaxID=5865 RepID=A7AN89_BABBO|nr:MerC mercury resistance family protein [Babesia bovis T2Bo]EDO08023.1 MerC mercury resistance family protein [Babesia bovis T2Bo]BAN65735.1 hypothetical protein [Babesia bovis]|eukprot:XP_001611591.1 hypothetical protein [Babesia bovis T2Bo]